MHILDVVPFIRGAPANTLSYRSKESIAIGTIVSVPLRNRTITAIVISCIPIRDAKAFLKTASFIPKSVITQSISRLPDIYYTIAAKIARRHLTSVGGILRQLFTNDNIISGFSEGMIVQGKKFIQKQYEGPYKDRVKKYHTLYKNRDEGSTVLYVVPSTTEAKRLARFIENAVIIHGEQRSPKRQTVIKQAFGAAAVIVTPPYAFTPIKKLSMIILERESAEMFINRQYPNIDMRVALYELAKARHATLLIGDYPIRLETRVPHNKSIQNRFHNRIHVLSTRTNDLSVPQQQYTTLPLPLRQIIRRAIDKKERVLLIAVRRGYATTAVCRDCGEIISDKHGRALSLATQNGKRIFRTTDGTIIQDADTHCRNCDSWNLIPLGAGIERVEEDVMKYFPDVPRIRFDSDTITKATMAECALEKARSQPSILIGTEKLFRWLEIRDLFSNIIIVSADSLLAIPFWRAREKFVRMILSLMQHTENMIVATRLPNDTACKALTQPHMDIFTSEELQFRKTLHYPPYGHLLIFRITGSEEILGDGEVILHSMFPLLDPTVLPDKIIEKNKYVRTLIYKRKQLPTDDVYINMNVLPHYITHTTDEESLW